MGLFLLELPSLLKSGQLEEQTGKVGSLTGVSALRVPAQLRQLTAEPFALVLHADAHDGVTTFLDSILTPDHLVVRSMAPATDVLEVRRGGRSETSESKQVLELLREQADQFEKVFISHPLGFSTSFLSDLLQMEKRFISMTHDYIWLLKMWQASFSELRTAQGGARNYAFKRILPKLELKTAAKATKELFEMMDSFKSVEVIPMPQHASGPSLEASKDLVIGVVGNLSSLEGLEAVLRVARQGDPNTQAACGNFRLGPRYLELGRWRLGQADAQHFSISHAGGQTAVIYRLDGTSHFGPRKDFSTWNDCCEQLDVGFGKGFVQIGSWRLGVAKGNLLLSHALQPSSPVVLGGDGGGGGELWKRSVEASNVLVSDELLKIEDWVLHYTEQRLEILHQERGSVQAFHANGHVKRGQEPKAVPPAPAWCAMSEGTKVIVFGQVPAGGADHLIVEPFNSTEHFNSLLRRYRPNVLLATAMWPAPHSDALALSMRTSLPIIVRQSACDFEAAAVEQARQYNGTYFHDFTDTKSVLSLAQQVKATSLTEVNPVLVVPRQWRNLLYPRLYNVVLVASKIHTSRGLRRIAARNPTIGTCG